ncbi:hypothetical protein QUB75_27585 [Microcoleus sp. K1-B6]|uniref:hypothetical protein n=1 Tax=unclassified Microcoleus TaxID=2642155 RepID=UPI002FD62345
MSARSKNCIRLVPAHYDDGIDRANRLSLRIWEHLQHHLALEAAKNSPEMQHNITQLQQLTAKWFNEHLTRY